MSPVSRKYQNDSTVGYFEPFAFGSAAKVSGIVLPRKRMPSCGSRYEMSVTSERMSRAPPMHWEMVTLSITISPSSLVSFAVRGRNSSIFFLSVVFSVDSAIFVDSSHKKVEQRASDRG